jgi:hypothetical protein
MGIRISDFVDVAERARALGCQVPTGLSILPGNFETAVTRSELLHESETPTVRTLWRKEGLIETPIEVEGERIPQVSEKSAHEWLGPIIFVSGALLAQNPVVIDVALGVISNYLTDWFKGVARENRRAILDVVVEVGNEKYKKLHFEGPVEGMKYLARIAREVGLGERQSS